MLLTLRDAHDHLQAVCEWWLVDERGQWCAEGRYVWVNDLQMNPGQRGAALLRRIIQQIAEAAPEALGAYWQRERKYGTSQLHAFRRTQLVKEEVRV